MEIEKIRNGAAILKFPKFQDARGTFVKTFQESLLRQEGISFTVKESYFSISAMNVIRGMHFQLPPHQHAKIVFCPHGAILDVIVDLRRQTDSYGQTFSKILSEENHSALYIPEGFAHGFKALTEGALTYYVVTSEYDKNSDTGIRYDSIGFDWQENDPIVSDRDRSFPVFADFKSPF